MVRRVAASRVPADGVVDGARIGSAIVLYVVTIAVWARHSCAPCAEPPTTPEQMFALRFRSRYADSQCTTRSSSAGRASTTSATSTSCFRAISSSSSPGLSGSGKSSLAFDTIYAEGQRRYVESLSAYARQFLGQMDKPDVDFIEGLSPAISIDQKSASRNPRSTVGTITEIYDYLRLLYAAHRDPALPELRQAHHPPDAAADRRPGAPAARRHPVPGARAGRAGPQGRVPRAARRARGPGLHPGPGRRRGRRSAGQARARAVRAAHDRGRRRPARAPGRDRAPAHRLARDRAEARRGCRRGRDRPQGGEGEEGGRARDPRVLRAPRVHALRALVRGARAPQLLVQLALRRVRDLRRSRHEVPGRSRAARPRRRPLDRRRCDRAVVGIPRRVLQARAHVGRRRATASPPTRRGRS